MKRVMISDLKAHLSAYVAAARRGETVIVCDRNTAVARLEPLDSGPDESWIAEPTLSLTELKASLDSWEPIELAEGVDPLRILDELREDRL